MGGGGLPCQLRIAYTTTTTTLTPTSPDSPTPRRPVPGATGIWSQRFPRKEKNPLKSDR